MYEHYHKTGSHVPPHLPSPSPPPGLHPVGAVKARITTGNRKSLKNLKRCKLSRKEKFEAEQKRKRAFEKYQKKIRHIKKLRELQKTTLAMVIREAKEKENEHDNNNNGRIYGIEQRRDENDNDFEMVNGDNNNEREKEKEKENKTEDDSPAAETHKPRFKSAAQRKVNAELHFGKNEDLPDDTPEPPEDNRPMGVRMKGVRTAVLAKKKKNNIGGITDSGKSKYSGPSPNPKSKKYHPNGPSTSAPAKKVTSKKEEKLVIGGIYYFEKFDTNGKYMGIVSADKRVGSDDAKKCAHCWKPSRCKEFLSFKKLNKNLVDNPYLYYCNRKFCR